MATEPFDAAESARASVDLPREFQQAFLLVALSRGESHGYELAEYLKGIGMPADLATVYRRLQAMERGHLIDSQWEASPAGPHRRVYALTAEGRLACEEAIVTLRSVARRIEDVLGSVRESS